MNRTSNNSYEKKPLSGLRKLGKRFPPDVINEMEAWSAHPELSKLRNTLESMTDSEQFLNHYSEAMLARYFMTQGWEIIGVEVQTTNRRHADFHVSKGNNQFYAHIKRLNLDKKFKVMNRLNDLRKKGGSYILYKQLTDREMQQFCKEAKKFLEKAKNGDSQEIKNSIGERLGEVEKATINGLTVGPPIEGSDEIKYYNMLSDAYKQFMPHSLNIIFVTSKWGDSVDADKAISSFLAKPSHSDASIIVWFEYNNKDIHCTKFEIFVRESYRNNCPSYINDLFGSQVTYL